MEQYLLQGVELLLRVAMAELDGVHYNDRAEEEAPPFRNEDSEVPEHADEYKLRGGGEDRQ